MIKLKFFNLFVKYAVISMLLHLYSLSSIAQYSLWDNHLCTTYISGIEQEGSDFWIATHGGGLLKLNPATGNTVYFNKHNSSIPSVLLTVIAIDSLGNKWIGSEYDGLLCFDVNNNWTCYNTLNSPLPSNEIKSICIKGGILWIGTKSGLARFDGINWTIFTSTIFGGINYWINDVRDIAIDSIGNIWICSFKTGLMKYDGTSWIVYNCNNIPQLSFNTQIEVSSVGIDKSGNIWAGILEKLFKFNGSTWAWGGGLAPLLQELLLI